MRLRVEIGIGLYFEANYNEHYKGNQLLLRTFMNLAGRLLIRLVVKCNIASQNNQFFFAALCFKVGSFTIGMVPSAGRFSAAERRLLRC